MRDTLSLLLPAIVGSRHNPLDELKIDTGGCAITYIITITPTQPNNHHILSHGEINEQKFNVSFTFFLSTVSQRYSQDGILGVGFEATPLVFDAMVKHRLVLNQRGAIP